MTLIASRENPTFKRLLRLRRRGGFDGEAVLLEGRRLVEDALAQPELCDCIIYSEDERGRYLSAALSHGLAPELVQIRLAPALFQRLTDTVEPQGVLLVARSFERPLAESQPLPLGGRSLILEGVSDPGNTGALLRSADAFGFTHVVRLGGASPLSAKALRAAMGAALRLQLLSAGSLAETLAWLERSEARLIVADLEGEALDALSFPRDESLALLVGSEAHGVSPAARQAASIRVTIGMNPAADSLNVSAAAAILLYHLRVDACRS